MAKRFFKKQDTSYGGELLKKRKNRTYGRPLDTDNSMHLVLRSSKAVKAWSFKKPKNEASIEKIVAKFSERYAVKIISWANVGTHLHFHIKLSNRRFYKAFIRAITAAIAMAVTGTSRWKPLKKVAKDRFWDCRPFTRIVFGYKAFRRLKEYIQVNQLEGLGMNRIDAR